MIKTKIFVLDVLKFLNPLFKVISLTVMNNGRIVTGDMQGTVRIWNEYNRTFIKSIDFTSNCYGLISYKDDIVISGHKIGEINIWNVTANTVQKLIGHTQRVFTLKILNNFLFSGSEDSTIKVWDLISLKLVNELISHTNRINSIVLLPKKNFLISCSWDTTIIIWNLTDYSLTNTIKAHSHFIDYLVVLPNNYLASASRDQTIKIWDTNEWNIVKEINFQSKGYISLEVLSNERLVAATDEESKIEILNYNTGDRIYTIKTDSNVNALGVLKNGNLLSGHNSILINVNVWQT